VEANVYGEYTRVIAAARAERWLKPLGIAHATPCTQREAMRMMTEALELPIWPPRRFAPRYGTLEVKFRRGARGTANYTRIVLPATPGGRIGCLRVGLALHEVAHTIADRAHGRRCKHGPEFRTTLRKLVEHWWSGRKRMDLREVYDRHPGPYSLVITKEGGKSEVIGPFPTADSTHEAAKRVYAEKRVLMICVFSDHLRYFIGVNYDEDNIGRLELAPEREQRTLLSERQEPVQPVGPVRAAEEPAERTHVEAPVRDVPAAAERRVSSRKPGALLELDPGNAEQWPRSAAAQLIRSTLEAHGAMSASALADATRQQMIELKVAHPASLVSRLKQAGLLRIKEEV
jgi:hypothetical protein